MILNYLPQFISLIKENIITPFLYLTFIFIIFFLLTILVAILFDIKLKVALFMHKTPKVELFYAFIIWLSLFVNADILGITIIDKFLTYLFFAGISTLFVLLIVFTYQFSPDSATTFHTIIFSFFVTTIIILTSLAFLIKNPENILVFLSIGITAIIFEKMINNTKYSKFASNMKLKVIDFLLNVEVKNE